MKYVKRDSYDDYQQPCTVYNLIEYNIDTNLTLLDNVIVYKKTVKRALIDRYESDKEDQLVSNAIELGFTEVTKEIYNQDIKDKKFVNLYPYREDTDEK